LNDNHAVTDLQAMRFGRNIELNPP
jgi:hypothetical protein